MGTRTPEANLRAYMPAAEVFARGKALRRHTPIGSLGADPVSPDRPTVLDYLASSNAGRLEHLIPLRMGRMLASPFTFFRGAAGLHAADLAGSPVSGPTAQLCGDAHAANFGLYGTPDGEIVMDINDFDETTTGPWEWDLKRLATSLVLAGREGGLGEKDCRSAAEASAKSYRRVFRRLAELPFLESWNALPDASTIGRAKADELLDDFERAAAKARANTSAKVVARWTAHLEDHRTGIVRHRFVSDPPILTEVEPAVADAVIDGLAGYVGTLRESRVNLITRFAVSDVAFRIVGTGSVGLRSYVVLLHGNADESLVLQVKQARPSALAPYLDVPVPAHEGERIVRGARLVQAETDILLGWTTITAPDGRSAPTRHEYIVRQFRNLKGDIDPTALNAEHLDDYGNLAGALLARAHSRSLDPRLLAGYLAGDRELDEVIGRYAVAYADRTEADHAELVRAVAAGRVAADVED